MKPAHLLLIASLAVPATALAQIPVGTRVGVGKSGAATGYDDGGRPDPFSSLVQPRRSVNPAAATATARTDRLGTVAVIDVKCTGVAREDRKYTSAILEGPNHLSYIVKPHDRLLDGVVKSIDALGVTLIEHTTSLSGAIQGREVRKLLHPAAEVIR